jgi:hypothetical protein
MESLKLRLEEAKDENKILQETKEMLEEQLERSGKFRQHIMSLETELFRVKSELNNAQVSFKQQDQSSGLGPIL